ncbi:hypothetical protein Cgig2_028129 [Carnegiea gigantea]|uniref:Uncharacterized protein n=1 Tax=Carnegiea gigantea TaxID=171969 RepID=A0A9Q1QE57_9CARY|nr:hypothetical protein Cgig2_028129 [Carnegiea gigantea]
MAWRSPGLFEALQKNQEAELHSENIGDEQDGEDNLSVRSNDNNLEGEREGEGDEENILLYDDDIDEDIVANDDDLTEGQGSQQEATFRKKVLSKENYWFTNSTLSHAISTFIKSFYDVFVDMLVIFSSMVNILGPRSLLKKFMNDARERKTPTPSALFAQSHSKEDAQSRKVFVDDRSKALWVQTQFHNFLFGFMKNMRPLEFSDVLKKGHLRHSSYIVKHWVDGAGNPPSLG